MNDFFLRVYLLSQLTRYRLAILRLIPGPSVHYSLIENPVVFPWYLRGLGGGVSQVSLIVLLKEFISDFLEYLIWKEDGLSRNSKFLKVIFCCV